MKCICHALLFLFVIACSGKSIIIEPDLFVSSIINDSFAIPDLTTHQSMAFCKGKAVFVTPVGDDLVCDIYDILTKDKESSINLSHGDYSVPHANVSCFGKDYFTNNSFFPTLYVSAWNEGRQAFVYDIFLGDAGYESRLVQIIDPAHLNKDYIGNGQMDWVIDVDHNMLYSIAYSLTNSPCIYENNQTNICQFELPTIDGRLIVYLEDKDIVNHFVLPVMTVFQDKCYYNHHIYVVAGIPSENKLYPPRLFDIDIDKFSLTEHLLPFDGEPEGLCYYNEGLWLNMCSSTIIHRLDSFLNNNIL